MTPLALVYDKALNPVDYLKQNWTPRAAVEVVEHEALTQARHGFP
ncbi:hypothetical protein ACAG24_009125 [Mycobacterium sp. pW049]